VTQIPKYKVVCANTLKSNQGIAMASVHDRFPKGSNVQTEFRGGMLTGGCWTRGLAGPVPLTVTEPTRGRGGLLTITTWFMSITHRLATVGASDQTVSFLDESLPQFLEK
jgi:hypothetical protein